MSGPARKADRLYTYGDYFGWDDGQRWELIDGVAYLMSPAPSRRHQWMLMELSRQVANYLVGRTCEVYVAPFDVRLPEAGEADEEVRTVVQPDLVVVCEPAKLDERGCRGAPDLAVEILSPSSSVHDLKRKLPLYERTGVRELWIVHPAERVVQAYRLGAGAGSGYGRPEAYGPEDRLASSAVEGLEVDLGPVFTGG